ncbi:MAG: hypothetical protein GC185_00415 [Alphaproteobacteria bacterium]|nr:hypothetical protein [Alphaproteobacteria bacterium]
MTQQPPASFNKAAIDPALAKQLGAEVIATINSGAAPDVQKIKDLCARGADLGVTDGNGASALMHAVLRKNQGVAEALLKAGALPDDPARNGMTPLMWAANLGDKDMGYLLLDHGADIDRKSPDNKTAADYATENNRSWLADKLNIYAAACKMKREAEERARIDREAAEAKEAKRQALERKLQAGLPTVKPVAVMKKISIRKPVK